MKIDWSPLRPLLAEHHKFLISSHVRPDADAIGSCLGAAYLLETLGKEARIVSPSAVPPNLKFLDPDSRVLHFGEDVSAEQLADAEVHLIVDTSAWQQLQDVGKWLQTRPMKRVVIDHHQSCDDLGALMLKDTSSPATGELIYRLYRELDIAISPAAATALYAAIATDTGWFRFAATTGDTMRAIGDLMDAGASAHGIFRELYEQCTLARLKLVARALDRVQVVSDGQIAFTYVTQADFSELNALPSDTEDLVNECLKIAGTQAAFIAIEQPSRVVKVSFRSRNGVDVAQVAEHFKGGGHRQAAGATLPGPIETAKATALSALQEALANLSVTT